MSQKKEGPESTEKKPGVKIQDLTPAKDAKGGAARNQNTAFGSNSARNDNSALNSDSALNSNSVSTNNSTKGLD